MSIEKSVNNLALDAIVLYVNEKKDNIERLRKEMYSEMEKAERLLYYHLAFNAIAMPTLIYFINK